MSNGKLTTRGKIWFIQRSLGTTSEIQQYIAVGTDGTDPTVGDTSLGNEVDRFSRDTAVAAFRQPAGNAEIIGEVSPTGGVEIPAGTEIKEIGVFSNQDNLLYRDTRGGVTIGLGDTVDFEISVVALNT